MVTDDGAPRRHRLFVAVWPPADVVTSLGRLVHEDEPGVRWVPPENLHVTLRFLGDAAPDEVVGRMAAAVLPAATAALGPVVSRLGHDAVVVPVSGLDDLAAVVRTVTADLGRPLGPRPFHGHLTIARLRRRAACGVAGAPVRATFPVDDVALVSSVTAASGAQYETLRRFPVSAR